MTAKITAWSFSRWNEYQACPFKSRCKIIDKLKEPSSPALERGTLLHKHCEDYLRGVVKTPHKDLKLVVPNLKELKKRGAIAEAEFTFTKTWEPTGWFDKDAWCRVKADVTIPPMVDAEVPTVEIHDFKSGKLKDAHSDYMVQLELYALAGLLTYPLAQEVKTSLIFIDHGKVVPHAETFTQGQVGKLTKLWGSRVKKMLSDTQFKATPGDACRWCHFSKSKGGPCQF